MHMAIANDEEPTYTRQTAPSVAFFLLSRRCPRSVHQHFSSPEDVDASNHSCKSPPPSASASVSAFAFPSRTGQDGSISTSTVSYIGSGASFFMDVRTSTDAGDGEGEFRVSLYLDLALSRSCRITPPNHNHNQPKMDLQTQIDPYFPLILQHERLQKRLQMLVPLLGSADIDMACRTSLSLRRSGLRSTSGSRGPSRSGLKSRSRHGFKAEKEKSPSSSRSGSLRSSSGSRVNSSVGLKQDLSKVCSFFSTWIRSKMGSYTYLYSCSSRVWDQNALPLRRHLLLPLLPHRLHPIRTWHQRRQTKSQRVLSVHEFQATCTELFAT